MRQFIAIAALLGYVGASSNGAFAQSFSTYGAPGLIDLPTAEKLEYGQLAFSANKFGATNRNTLFFQFLPQVYGTFRYAITDDFNGVAGDRHSRSFDLHFQLAEERGFRPAIALGLRDIMGSGVYGSEYLVATKTIVPGLKLTGGLGWGRLGQRNGMKNPLGVFSSHFERRPAPAAPGSGGDLESDSWFRGDMAPFGGLSWDVNDRLTLKVEYSSDTYSEEATRGVQFIDGPINLGLAYQFSNGIELNAFAIGKDDFGAQLSYQFNPRSRPVPGGTDRSAPALVARDSLASASWNLPQANGTAGGVEAVLTQRLNQQGLILEGLQIDGTRVAIRVQNKLWESEAQAAGRAARVLANTMASNVETFEVIFQKNGVPITRITTQRSDLYELAFDYDGAWRSQARAQITDAQDAGRDGQLPDAFPQFDFSIAPFARLAFFDPDQKLRYEFGPEVVAAYRPTPGLTFSTTVSYPIISNIDSSTPLSNSVIQKVRSDAVRYAQESELELNQLTAEYLFRPGEDLFGRVTAGYLESMYGGLSAELLWFPINSRLALGAEVNYARQRDFDILFDFQNYDVWTGHASAYYDFGSGFLGQVDAGRYLAGDWGTTVNLTREFNNGFRVGGFVTLTDVAFSDFGEGSFDKGIVVEVPTAWLTGQPSRNKISQVIRPVVRDGGARLDVNNRLYDFTRDYRANDLQNGWGRYFR